MSVDSQNKGVRFPSGGGEMGTLIRSKDWSGTSLGPMDSWPQSLQTVLGILLNSKSPMVLFWGQDPVCFINDATLEALGNDIKQADIFSDYGKEIRHFIQPLAEQVMESGEAWWCREQLIPVDRNGESRDIYWDLSYSPVNDETGKIAGVFVTCMETVDKVEILTTKQQLEDAEERLRLALDATNLGTWDLDLKTREMIYSPTLAVIFGHPETAVLSHRILRNQIHRNDIHTVVEAAFDRALQTGIYCYEARMVKPGGAICLIRTQGKVVFDKEGAPARMLGTTTDITEQKQSEEKFAKLAAIVQTSDDAIVSKTLDGIITSWNAGAERIFGYTESEMIGQSILKLIPADRLDEEPAILSRLKKGERVDHFETKRVTKDKNIIDVSLTISPLNDSSGNIIGVSKIARDITIQKRAEKLIAENEERLQIIVSASDLGVWEINLLTGEMNYSERYYEMLGHDKYAKVSHQDLQKHLHPDDLHERERAFKTAFETGYLSFQTRVIWKDQTIHWIEAKGKVLHNAENKPYKITGTARDITRDRSYQQRIEESEKRFRIVADTAPVLIWMSDSDSHYYFLNKAWLDFTGRPAEEEIGMGWMNGIHPDDRARFTQTNDLAFLSKKPFTIEYRLRRADGEYRWISDNGLPRFTEDGMFEGFIGACMDIHDRILFEEKLQESESRLRIAALSSELGTWDYNPETEVLRWDNVSRELFGVGADTPVTLELFWSKVHPDDRKEALQKMLRALDPAKADTYDTEYRVIGLPDQKIRWIHAKGKAFFDPERKAYLFSGTVLDVTEKRLALEELLESEAKFRLLADSMPQFIWTGDEQGNLNYFNSSVYEYTGLTPEQVATGGWLQIIHPEDRAENIRRWMYSVSTGEPFLFEHRFRGADGEYRWRLSRAVPQKDTDGVIQKWVGTSTDIHDQKTFARELENQVQQRTYELKQSNNELIKSNNDLAQFAYVASHDLQEPLRKIQTFCARILETDHEHLSEKGRDYFGRMQLASSRMQQLILDLLSFSRTNAAEKHFEPVDLNHVLKTVKDHLKESIDQKHVSISAGKMPILNAVAYQFEQLFTNMLSNAIKFSKPDQAPKIEIRYSLVNGRDIRHASADRKKKYHRIIFSDNGIGFDPQFKDRIFNVFQRLHGREEYAGTGIGLSIVKKIVENHHGFIEAEGELNKGATFTVYLLA